jgi:hypothetical protein
MISPADCWVLGRLLCGHSLNGQLAPLIEQWHGMATHLAGLPLSARQSAWGVMLLARPDRHRAAKVAENEWISGRLAGTLLGTNGWGVQRRALLGEIRTRVLPGTPIQFHGGDVERLAKEKRATVRAKGRPA